MSNYIDQFLRFTDTLPESTGRNGGNPSREFGHSYGESPAETAETIFAVSAGSSDQESSDFTPPWPPRPVELADWPVEWREQWGRLANKLEHEGIPFPESERRAFEQVEAAMGLHKTGN